MSLLIELLTSLTENEKKELRHHFLQSQHTEKLEIRLLFYLLKSKIVTNDRQKIWEHLYPQQVYRELRLNNIFSRTLKLVYKWLTVTRTSEATQLAAQLDLVSQLQQRNLTKHANRLLLNIERSLEDAKQQSYQTAQLRYQVAAAKDHAALKLSRKHSPFLQQTATVLDQYYLINKLRLACDMRSRSKIVTNQSFDFSKLDALVELFELETKAKEDPVISLYLQLYHFLSFQQPAAKKYHVLLTFIQQHDHLISTTERKDVYNYLLN